MWQSAKKHHVMIMASVSFVICMFIWPVVADFSAKQIQPIASAVSTIAGILFGFVMASITLFASAKDNTLIRNTTLTGYLPKLVNKLHFTMGLLLAVCFIFLVVLFIPDTADFAINDKTIKLAAVVMIVGVFVMLNAFANFFVSWNKFKEFSAHM